MASKLGRPTTASIIFGRIKDGLTGHFQLTPDDYLHLSDLSIKYKPPGVLDSVFALAVQQTVEAGIIQLDPRDMTKYVVGPGIDLEPDPAQVDPRLAKGEIGRGIRANSPSAWVLRVLVEAGFNVQLTCPEVWERARSISGGTFTVHVPGQVPSYIKSLIDDGVIAKTGERRHTKLHLTGRPPYAARHLEIFQKVFDREQVPTQNGAGSCWISALPRSADPAPTE